MNRLIYLLFSLCFLYTCTPATSTEQTPTTEPVTTTDSGQEISFYTPDSIHIWGDLYTIEKTASTILLFHQGGSNARGEYSSIIPRLREAGYNVLAIDQRLGGQTYGSYNRTIVSMAKNDFTYCDALPDLESALDYMINEGYTGSKILWGSSYSATLAIQLANRRPTAVQAVLAFSPASGGPMEACRPDTYFPTVEQPLLLLRPASEMERQSSQDQLELARQSGHQTYVAQQGVHGSSLLVADRVAAEVTENWAAVMTFLTGLGEE